jgi:hypothetical protein
MMRKILNILLILLGWGSLLAQNSDLEDLFDSQAKVAYTLVEADSPFTAVYRLLAELCHRTVVGRI